ncbi:class I SAM-dependent methyltransferase [Aestuariivirga litoralis]|uniref:class I SAM-dependent methyltransferase n=1 Tax=Aestuariivirga litoralis TaxID=2650924 RepID=UPI0018C4B441|nr:class I SAM-dependent methyltransferase [Aestuariivirga litoralis]MBG1231813.1 class I SAM-dependent methyltransferase [Aestuariivirga litoralis]
MSVIGKDLRDPDSFGEDLFAIANRAAELAPIYCQGCASYHWRIPAQRALGVIESLGVDRYKLVSEVREILGPRYLTADEISIVLAGSADTGLLATLAHAVASLSADAVRRTTFLVMDLCATPLHLCMEFAAQQGLVCDVRQGNLLNLSIEQPVDLVVMHGILRFFQLNERTMVVRNATSWLKPQGRIMISNSFEAMSDRESAQKRRDKELTQQRLADAVEQGLLKSPSAMEGFAAEMRHSVKVSMQRDRIFLTLSDLINLAGNAGLIVQNCSFAQISEGDGKLPEKKRIIAVLRPEPTEQVSQKN